MATALVLGCTGLTGSHILATLRNSAPHFSSIEVVARRAPPPAPEAAVPTKAYVEKDTSQWGAHIASTKPPPAVVFYALASTRASAGGFDNQYRFEHDMMAQLATAAKDAGINTYVLVSAAGADPKSIFGYQRMKGELEEYVKKLDFKHTIIVRPGMILGERANQDAAGYVLNHLATACGYVHASLKNAWAQDAHTIANAAVSASLQIERGEVKDKIWTLGGSEIIRLGKGERLD